MTSEEIRLMTFEMEFEMLALAITTATLLSGWLPDEGGIHNDRVMKAVYLARDIVYDARSTVTARRIK